MSSDSPSPAQRWKSINVNEKPPRKRFRSSVSSRAASSLIDPNSISLPVKELQPITRCHLERRSELHQSDHPSIRDNLGPFCSPDGEFKVAIDLGTTFTAVAYVVPGFDPEDPTEILTIRKFPKDPFPSNKGRQVPTESWYPNRPGRGKKRKQQDTSVMLATEGEGRAPMHNDDIFGISSDNLLSYDDIVCTGYLHGFEVQDYLRRSITDSPKYARDRRVSRMKLLLDNSPLTEELREELQTVLDGLKQDNFIKKNEDVIRDYLAVVLLHTKLWLETYHEYNSQSKVEVIFCVPVCWAPRANAAMEHCVTEAMFKTGFGVSNRDSVPRLFMVNEAEAAATFTLKANLHTLTRSETFVLLDCGGGTVDAGTYKVANEEPLRLEQEIINPAGALCGSSYLNQRMAEFSWTNLREQEDHLAKQGRSIQSIIDQEVMTRFEESYKRSVDFSKPRETYWFQVIGLKKSPSNPRLKADAFVLTQDDMKQIFEPCLRQIRALMRDQIDRAHVKEVEVDKVVLVGGFADSHALCWALGTEIRRLNEYHGSSIELIIADKYKESEVISATGVAKGAILRACDKENGPARRPRLSYGVLRHLEYQNEEWLAKKHPALAAALKEGKKKYNHLDGKYWIEDTIEWIIKAGEGPIKSEHRIHFKSIYTFRAHDVWRQTEDLYISETCTKDFYQKDHPNNKGKFVKAGKMALDLRPLKAGILAKGSGTRRQRQKTYYDVEVLVELLIIDRDLKFRVRYPATENGEVIQGSDRSFSLISAFQPGTQ